MRLRPFLPRIRRVGRTAATAAQRRRRTLIACGLLAAMLWPGPLAGAPIDDALSLVTEGRFAEAEELLDELREEEPEAADLRLILGVLRAREGKFTEAIEVFEDLRDDYPGLFEVYNNLAVLYAGLGRLDDAREALVAAIDLEPDPVVYNNLGDVYMRLAQRAYARAQEFPSADTAPPAGDVVDAPAPRPPKPTPSPVASTVAATVESAPLDSVQAESAPAETVAVESAAVQSAAACIRTDAFKEGGAATEAAAWLRSRGAGAVALRQEERREVKNHRLYLPAPQSRAEAKATVLELRRRGVQDVALVNKGPLAGAISLGVYGNESNTRRRITELQKLGYSVEVEANMRSVMTYAVEARVDEDRSALDDAWTAAYPNHAIRSVACASPE